jgi:hypothetical protein
MPSFFFSISFIAAHYDVVCDNILLMPQIHEEARKFSYQTGVRVVVAYGGAPIHQQVYTFHRIMTFVWDGPFSFFARVTAFIGFVLLFT